jgi:hypothetical protein
MASKARVLSPGSATAPYLDRTALRIPGQMPHLPGAHHEQEHLCHDDQNMVDEENESEVMTPSA